MGKNIERNCIEYDSERDISGSAGGAYGHYLADRLMWEKENKLFEKKAELEEKIEFIEKVNKMNVNIDNIFLDRDIKARLIREYKGYTKLNSLGQKHKNNEKGESLSNCSDSKIGLAFKNIYYSTLKKLNE